MFFVSIQLRRKRHQIWIQVKARKININEKDVVEICCISAGFVSSGSDAGYVRCLLAFNRFLVSDSSLLAIRDTILHSFHSKTKTKMLFWMIHKSELQKNENGFNFLIYVSYIKVEAKNKHGKCTNSNKKLIIHWPFLFLFLFNNFDCHFTA